MFLLRNNTMQNNYSTLTAKITFCTSLQNHYTDFSKYFHTFGKNNLTFLFRNTIMRILNGARIAKAPRSTSEVLFVY